jgi:uncharacterized membrane protein YraQ (UPF0718 family)
VIVSGLILLTATLLVAVHAWRREPAILRRALCFAGEEGQRLAIRIPFAIVAATCLAELLPDQAIAGLLGSETGLGGIIAAALLGGLLPGGPIVSFPIAILLAKEGAGGPQLVALLTGWSIYAFHRVIAFEWTIMGWRFTMLRLAASWFLPPLAGVLAGVIAAAIGIAVTLG